MTHSKALKKYMRNRSPLAVEHLEQRMGVGCPRCYSKNLNGQDTDFWINNGLRIHCEGVSCQDCGFTWGDLYVLLDITVDDSNEEPTASELIRIEALRQQNSQPKPKEKS